MESFQANAPLLQLQIHPCATQICIMPIIPFIAKSTTGRFMSGQPVKTLARLPAVLAGFKYQSALPRPCSEGAA
ncbi:hypothetical protein ABH892_000422 [Paenibacillus sp. RC254]|uniref:hypothetical protein n=1 Tax=unclassified Paenibacillus TaxID=185978 RepID=UPI0024BA1108|nr:MULTISPECIES: hypothetical protein [unclassified Paenibacillus]